MKTAKRVIFCAAALIALSGLAFSASSSEDTKGGSMGSGSESSTGTDSGSSPGGSTGTDSGSSTGGSTGTDSGSSPGGSTGTDSGDKSYDLEDSRQSIPGGPMGTYSSSHGSKKGPGSDIRKKR